MYIKRLNIIGFCLLFITVINACVDDDICDKPVTPRLTIGFINSLGSRYTVDTLYVDEVSSGGIVTSGNKFASIDSVRLPLNSQAEQTVFYFYNRKNTIDTDKDIITVKYTTSQKFISKACGYKVIFDNVSYDLSRAVNMKGITPNTSQIHNESKNLFVTY